MASPIVVRDLEGKVALVTGATHRWPVGQLQASVGLSGSNSSYPIRQIGIKTLEE